MKAILVQTSHLFRSIFSHMKLAHFNRWRQILITVFFVLVSFCTTQTWAKSSELNIWIMSTTAQPQQDMREILRPYLVLNPHLRVNVTVINWENAWSKISAAADSGQGPDLVELGSTWVAAIAAKNALEPISLQQQKEVGGDKVFFLPYGSRRINIIMVKYLLFLGMPVHGLPIIVAIYLKKLA